MSVTAQTVDKFGRLVLSQRQLSVSIIVFRSLLVSYEHQQRRTKMQMVSVSVSRRPSVAVCDLEPCLPTHPSFPDELHPKNIN